MEPVTISIVAFIAVVLVAFLYASIKIVNQYERLLVFTLGRTSPQEVKGPGWVFLVPFVQRGVRVTLQEQFIEIPSQTNITRDNAPIAVDFLIYWRIVDPYKSVVEVLNFNGALQGVATTSLRAVITESEGTRQAAINVAEGQKQSEILKAEGERQAQILRAEGFSLALERIYGAASGVDQKTMALQYLEALKALGASPSTKFVIPTEFTRLVEPFAGFVERGMADGGSGGRPMAPRSEPTR